MNKEQEKWYREIYDCIRYEKPSFEAWLIDYRKREAETLKQMANQK